MRQSATTTVLCDQPTTLSSGSTMKKKPTADESPAEKSQQRVVIGRSPAGTRRVTPEIVTWETKKTEMLLPNGDLYSGELSANVPHGSGKYLWADGCMYEGEWRKGKARGKGKFSWPSGATYDGEFKSGRMDGFGTFIGADGYTYRGTWSSDRKHGRGEKRYANGDLYTGGWRKNVQDGYGRYVWMNGNEYRGEWKNGVISGRGTLIWSNGARYDGHWENGMPKSNDGESCDAIVHSNEPFGARLDLDHLRRDVKKPGQIIVKGHKNYELMLNLQLGISVMLDRHSVGKESAKFKELKASDFDPMEKFWTRFPREGSKTTPPHQSTEFRWKDYCPVVFRELRKLFHVDPADYMLAICGNGSIRELSSPGKSGSVFYLTQDDRFMIKTVRKSEVKVLLRMLSSYYQHVSKHENTLVTKFYGVHCVKPVGGQKTRFIVMGNLFCSAFPIHKRFDLKGSSHGRSTDKQKDIDETTTLKDLDLDFKFRLQENWYTEMIKQIDIDCKFLESERIMDYSLLVGVHFRSESTVEKMGLDPFLSNSGKADSFRKEKSMSKCRLLEAELQSMDTVFSDRNSSIKLGANMPARAERMRRKSDVDQPTFNSSRRHGEEYEVILYFGIIDVLQDYDITKKLEHAYKSLQVSPTSISAVDPKLYAKRFKEFIGRIFLEDE